MRVVILGSGVVGVTSAWYLSQAGHDVTVIDRESGPAQETSAANAGQISPGYAAPWAAPGVPLKAIKWMFQRHAPLAVRLDGTPFQLKWMWQMLRNCDTRHYMENKGRMVRLAEYSRDCLKTLRAATGIEYEGRQGGTLQLFRTAQQYENATRDIAVLEDAGVPYQLLEASRLAEVEPALAEVAHKLTGGLRLPNDETGDCQLFTQRLARRYRRFLMKPTKSLLRVLISVFAWGEWRKSWALIPTYCNRAARRWRWLCAISFRAAVILSRPHSGPACAP